MSCRLPLLLFALAPATLLAESAQPSIGYTGAPTDHGGQNCSRCHNSFGPANSDPTGSLTVQVQNYTSAQQNIVVTINHPTASRWGFQMTIREVSDETLEAGTFSDVSGMPFQVVCDDGSQFGSQPPCTATTTRQFTEHVNAPRTAAGAGFSWTIPWTPPPNEVGRLHVYVAAVAADGDGTDQGDRVYTKEITISSSGSCSIPNPPQLRTVVNGASFQPPISSNAMISVLGLDFQVSGYRRSVGLGDLENNDTTFPTVLGCVAIEVTGPGITQPVRIPIAYVQQDQINAQLPEFTGTGPVTLTVLLNPDQENQFKSDLATLTAQQAFAPAFFIVPNSTTIAAQIANTSIPVADPTLVPGGQPAKPGQIVTLYGTGFGDTNPLIQAGELAPGAAPLVNPITVTVGTTTVPASDILYAGASPGSITGLYQFNVQLPASTPSGNVPITISIGGFQTQSKLTIPVQ